MYVITCSSWTGMKSVFLKYELLNIIAKSPRWSWRHEIQSTGTFRFSCFTEKKSSHLVIHEFIFNALCGFCIISLPPFPFLFKALRHLGKEEQRDLIRTEYESPQAWIMSVFLLSLESYKFQPTLEQLEKLLKSYMYCFVSCVGKYFCVAWFCLMWS